MRRTEFLQSSGALVVAFTLPVVNACAPADPSSDVDSWLAIEGNGGVTVSWGKVELGTGIDTAITQLVADELYVPFVRVRLAVVTTSTPNQGYTAGSESLSVGGVAVRQAAATARGVLLNLGAQRFGVASGDLRTDDGVVYVATDPKRRIGYGELIGGERLNERVQSDAPVRP